MTLSLSRVWAAAWVLLALTSAASATTVGPLPSAPAVEARILLGRDHSYAIALCAGQFLRVRVDQPHLDLVVRVISPDGRTLAEVDNSADRGDPLTLSVIAVRDGAHQVAVRLRGRRAASGRYRISSEPPRPAGDGDDLRIQAEAGRREGDRLLAKGTAESRSAALDRYAEARDVFHALADRSEEAATLGRMADALGGLARLRETLAYAEETLALWRLAGDRRGEAAALDRVGLAVSELGDQRRALELLDRALEFRRADGDAWGQAETLNDIAVARGALGEIPEAIARYTEALELARRSGDRLIEAWVWNNRAIDYRQLGETDRALADMRRARAMFRDLGDRHQEGVTEYALGNAYLDREEIPQSLVRLERARALLRETGDKRFEAFALEHMGLAHLAAKRASDALRDFEQARAILRESGDRRGEAMAAANAGYARLRLGEVERARRDLRDAVEAVRESADRVHEAVALVYLARAERAAGDLAAARDRLEEAVALTEALRGSIPEAGERASFLATARDRYDALIDVLMELNAREPGRGWDAEAFHVSERARARSLVELVAEARIDLREGADEALLEREREIEAEIERRRLEDQRRLAAGAPPPAEASRQAMDALLADYRDVQIRLRAASPRFAALVRPEPLELSGVQRELLDDDTLLLEYALGEPRSFVFAVTRSTLTSQVLPGRSAVEAAARRLYEAWSRRDALDGPEAARRALALARMLLGPVRDRLRVKRIAIVAEGTVQYVPFAALPIREGGETVPLVAGHDVVTLPSATTLSVVRRASRRSEPARTVAVLADAVFDASDPRVTGAAGTPAPASDALTRSMLEAGLQRLERLPASRLEAQSIAALAPARSSFTALDFRASRATALSDEIAAARVVHFASHGLLNSRHPELSGIVLSLVDERGRPVDGFLQVRDVYRLNLSAELVVLSACQTALGREVRGEGLVGLARGFMYAGTPRVVASLWRVPDTATAEFMARFYRAMLRDGLPPSAALSAAQRSFRSESLWSSPYYWGAFTLQGEWE